MKVCSCVSCVFLMCSCSTAGAISASTVVSTSLPVGLVDLVAAAVEGVVEAAVLSGSLLLPEKSLLTAAAAFSILLVFWLFDLYGEGYVQIGRDRDCMKCGLTSWAGPSRYIRSH